MTYSTLLDAITLTADQKTSRLVPVFLVTLSSWFLMLTAPLDAEAQTRTRRGWGWGANVSLFLSNLPEVQRELDLSLEQMEMFEALQRDLSAQFRGRRERSGQEKVNRLLFATLLDRQQVRRFDELRVQFEGLTSLQRSEVRDQLNVSEEQYAEIRRQLGSRSSQAPAEEQLKELLDESQLAAWVKLCGKQFEFSDQTKRFRQFIRQLRPSFRDSDRRRDDRDREESDEEDPQPQSRPKDDPETNDSVTPENVEDPPQANSVGEESERPSLDEDGRDQEIDQSEPE